MKLRIVVFSFLTFFSLNSCFEEQDFDQFDDLDVVQTIEGSILYIESPEALINLTNQSEFYNSTFNYDAFNEGLFADRVLEGIITYQIENTTSKPFNVIVEFISEDGEVLDTEEFIISEAPTSIVNRDVAYGGTSNKDIEIITGTSSFKISAFNLGDYTSTATTPNPKIILRSSGKFKVLIK